MSFPPSKRERKEDEAIKPPPEGYIRFELDNISTMDKGRRSSAVIEVRGMPWAVWVWKRENHLSFCLNRETTQFTQWSIDVRTEWTIIHSDSSKNINKEASATYDSSEEDISECYLDLEKNIEQGQGFIKDDKITVECRFWMSNMRGIKNVPRFDFTDPNDPRNDLALLIDGVKIYANKGILAVHSPFFNTMFNGDFVEKNKNEIELKDVDRKEFIEMLRVIYPSGYEFPGEDSGDVTCENMLKLGDRFQMPFVIECAEKAVIDCWNLLSMAKLRIADKYKLPRLMEHCLSELKSTKDFKKIEESPLYNDLSPETMRALFERHIKIAN